MVDAMFVLFLLGVLTLIAAAMCSLSTTFMKWHGKWHMRVYEWPGKLFATGMLIILTGLLLGLIKVISLASFC